ncbi:hypothetical protein SteCoe_25535 [Stentor coeruleus]|uniref:Uncharacterized protein n=1 Tax=Stentor coeruleus TaxID=5963 RepID=A0A1R2BF16_9CILI|nr:hypothetical protein SteCoe_25535 [Stentor coeruleus]
MEGKFLTKDQRVNLAQQIRKTHFTLGGEVNSYNTTSSNNFKSPYSLNGSQSTCNLSTELRKTHLVMGNDYKPRCSEFNFSYSNKKPDLSQSVLIKKDLSKHSMILGTTSTCYNPTASNSYKPLKTNIQHVNSACQIKRNLRKHHFNLGTDPTTKTSTFTENFYEKQAEKVTKNEELKKDLCESHFTLGRAPKMLKSTSQSQYPSYNIQNTHLSKTQINNLRKEHFNLGSEYRSSSSSSNMYHITNPENKQNPNKKMHDLKSSHIILGKAQSSYSLTSKFSNNRSKSSDNIKLKTSGVIIRDSHFTMGDDSLLYKTSYISTHIKPNIIDQAENPNSHRHLTSSLKFGDEKMPISNTQSSFKHIQCNEVEQPDPKLIKDLKNHHFTLSDGGKYYKTTSKDLGQKGGEPGKIDPNIVKNIMASHFKYGADPDHLLSSNQNDYKKPQGVRVKYDNSLSKNLRKTHFCIGNDKGLWKTEQQNEYNWIQPVADKEYRPSQL